MIELNMKRYQIFISMLCNRIQIIPKYLGIFPELVTNYNNASIIGKQEIDQSDKNFEKKVYEQAKIVAQSRPLAEGSLIQPA